MSQRHSERPEPAKKWTGSATLVHRMTGYMVLKKIQLYYDVSTRTGEGARATGRVSPYR